MPPTTKKTTSRERSTKAPTLPEKLRNKTWISQDGDFNSGHLEAMLKAIAKGEHRDSVFDKPIASADRRVDKATQLLRKAGLIALEGSPRKWVIVEHDD